MTCLSSQNFRAALFLDVQEYEEVPLRDRKSNFPVFQKRCETAEFLRDVIALGNTARLFGKAAYLLFGIDDDGKVVGVEKYLQHYGPVGDAKVWEKVRHRIRQSLAEYISPSFLKWELKHGIVEEKQVAYLLIEPIPNSKPFTVKKRFPRKGKNKELVRGQSWIRTGESKMEVVLQEISPVEAPYCYAHAQVPYLLPSMWRKYFEGLLADRKLEFLDAQEILAYQELFTDPGVTLKEKIQDFLDEPSQLLVIKGAAGCGKTAFLKRLAATWTERGLEAVKGFIEREEFTSPLEWIPVYYSLRAERINGEWSLDKQLVNRLNALSQSSFWKERPTQPEKLLEYANLHWLVCLDGLDEIWTREQRWSFIGALKGFLDHYPRVKLILTTRPDMESTLVSLGDIVEVMPLTNEQILKYVKAFPGMTENCEEFLNILKSHGDLWNLCGIPACLEATLSEISEADPSYLETPPLMNQVDTDFESDLTEDDVPSGLLDAVPRVDADELILEQPYTEEVPEMPLDISEDESPRPISLGILLDRMYQHLWGREILRHATFSEFRDEWWDATGELAITTDGTHRHFRRKQALEYLSTEEAWYGLLSLGILKRRNSRSWFCFNTLLTQEYFAATFVEGFVKEDCVDEALHYVEQADQKFREDVRALLMQLTYFDLNSLFEGGKQ